MIYSGVPQMSHRLPRRDFLKAGSAAAVGVAFAGLVPQRLFAASADGFEPIRVAAETAPAAAGRRVFEVRPHELDPMAHANNAIYVDWLEEALLAAGMGGVLSALPRTYRLEYLAAAAPGAELEGIAWTSAVGTARYRLADGTGRDVLRAEVIAG